ncbi:hypothetical protein HYX13_05655 [Candidatus Woesearchaeota archaeon]|nr:hypothetical protein [Candidatus Woesearchaeota archaeon]
MGVKHVNLAEGNPVKAAGQLFIDAEGKYFFNTESGSFTLPLKEKGIDESALQEKISLIFAKDFGYEGESTTEILLPPNKPSLDDLVIACRNFFFRENNLQVCS